MPFKKLLWLDDIRNPDESDWLNFSPIPRPFDVFWVNSYLEFINWILENGLPDGICFDHDLGGDEFSNEKTGYDCAKWLVNYCIDNNETLPKWNVHSSNSAGKENINKLFLNFIKNIKKL